MKKRNILQYGGSTYIEKPKKLKPLTQKQIDAKYNSEEGRRWLTDTFVKEEYPEVRYVTNKLARPDGRPNYNAITGGIHIPTNSTDTYEADVIAELAHANQNRRMSDINMIATAVKDAGKNILKGNFSPQQSTYEQRGTLENEAHSIIEPTIVKKYDEFDLRLQLPEYRDEFLKDKLSMKKQYGGVKQFYTDYLKSPNFQKRALETRIEDPDELAAERLRSLRTMKVTNKSLKGGKVSSTRYNANTNISNIDKKDAVGITEDELAAHEFSHATGSLIPMKNFNQSLTLSPAEVQMFDDRKKFQVPSKQVNDLPVKDMMQFIYGTQPNEAKADMDQLRYQLKRDGVYDTGTQTFDKKHLQKARQRYKNQRFLKNYKDEDIIFLMNNIAGNIDPDDIEPVAQYGGSSGSKVLVEKDEFYRDTDGNIRRATDAPSHDEDFFVEGINAYPTTEGNGGEIVDAMDVLSASYDQVGKGRKGGTKEQKFAIKPKRQKELMETQGNDWFKPSKKPLSPSAFVERAAVQNAKIVEKYKIDTDVNGITPYTKATQAANNAMIANRPTIEDFYETAFEEQESQRPKPKGSKAQYGGVPTSLNGLWDYPQQPVVVPSGDITMEGIDYPVDAFDNETGEYLETMQPDMNYNFDANEILEVPSAQWGKSNDVRELMDERREERRLEELGEKQAKKELKGLKKKGIKSDPSKRFTPQTSRDYITEKVAQEFGDDVAEEITEDVIKNGSRSTFFSRLAPKIGNVVKAVGSAGGFATLATDMQGDTRAGRMPAGTIQDQAARLQSEDPEMYDSFVRQGFIDPTVPTQGANYRVPLELTTPGRPWSGLPKNSTPPLVPVSTNTGYTDEYSGNGATVPINETVPSGTPIASNPSTYSGRPDWDTGNYRTVNQNGNSYVVGKGDWMSSIAAANGIKAEDIIAANPQIKDPNKIVPGDVLNIPDRPPLSKTDLPTPDLITTGMAGQYKSGEINYDTITPASPAYPEVKVPANTKGLGSTVADGVGKVIDGAVIGRLNREVPTNALRALMMANRSISLPYRPEVPNRTFNYNEIDATPQLNRVAAGTNQQLQNLNMNTSVGQAVANSIGARKLAMENDIVARTSQANRQIRNQTDNANVQALNQMDLQQEQFNSNYVDGVQQVMANHDRAKVAQADYFDKMIRYRNKSDNDIALINASSPNFQIDPTTGTIRRIQTKFGEAPKAKFGIKKKMS